ncbi:MAG: dihydrolipoyl dehydrogenase [Elusimicrobiota bacterium]
MEAIVIGGGPGGYPAALKLKALGAKVTVIEKGDFGGTCLNRGCIPSKALLEIGHRKHNFEELSRFTSSPMGETALSWEKIKEHKTAVVGSIRSSLEKLFSMKKIEILRGEASFESPTSVTVKNTSGEKIINFDFAVLATGTSPFYPPPFSQFKDRLADSDNVFDLEKFPSKMTIIGAGVIGLELACFFNSLGSQIEIVELMPEILPFEDPLAARALKNSLEKRGIKFHLGVKTKELFFENGKKTVILENEEKIEADEILVAAGRKAFLEKLNLSRAGIEAERWVKTGMDLKTSNPKIYAVGDINGISLLAHSAEKQGEIAAENIFGGKHQFDASIVPSCVYTWPELASVGLTKNKAQELGLKPKVRKSFYQVLGRAIASINTEGFCQLVTDEKDIIIGAQIVGGPATEIIHTAALAVKMKLTAEKFNSMIFAHPTMTEIIKEALSATAR